MAPDPKVWAEQQIGLTIASALSNHILAAYHDVKVTPITECNCKDKFNNITESYITPDFDVQNSAVYALHDASCLCRTPRHKMKGGQTQFNSSVLLVAYLWVTVGLPYQQNPQMYVLFLYRSEYRLL